jgi:hypothetical protein
MPSNLHPALTVLADLRNLCAKPLTREALLDQLQAILYGDVVTELLETGTAEPGFRLEPVGFLRSTDAQRRELSLPLTTAPELKAALAGSFPVAVNWSGEVAAIWARLYRDRADDALEMAALLVSDPQRQAALKELDESLRGEAEEMLFAAGLSRLDPKADEWFFNATSPAGESQVFGPYFGPEQVAAARVHLESREYHDFSEPYCYEEA